MQNCIYSRKYGPDYWCARQQKEVECIMDIGILCRHHTDTNYLQRYSTQCCPKCGSDIKVFPHGFKICTKIIACGWTGIRLGCVKTHKKDLVLHVKKVYFDAVCDGSKKFEYREQTEYWSTRLRNNIYPGIQIHCGYPKNSDKTRIVFLKWIGFKESTIIHDQFKNNPTFVFVIPLEVK